METSNKKSNKKLFVILGILAVIVVIGMAYYLTNKKDSKITETETKKESKSGLSSLLGSLNLSGLTIFGAGK